MDPLNGPCFCKGKANLFVSQACNRKLTCAAVTVTAGMGYSLTGKGDENG